MNESKESLNGTKESSNESKESQLGFQAFEELVGNVMMARSEMLRHLASTRRDIDDECDYPKAVEYGVYQDLYDREAVANRVVQVLPRECWQVQPLVYEEEDAGVITPFEEAWMNLGKNLRGEPSSFSDPSGTMVWEYLSRGDILSGIGRFGIILLGLDDGLDWREPAVIQLSDLSMTQPSGSRQLLFLRTFPESLVQISRFESDPRSSRFGCPLEYLVTFNGPEEQGGIGLPLAQAQVHWSRVIHLADNLASSEVFGSPRMKPVLNRLLDLRKLYGGSAEMYWRGAFPGLSFETHPQLGGEVEIDRDKLRREMENYMNGLQRYLALMGMSAKTLAPQVVDPTPQINVQIEAICIKLGVPKRVFMGSERGELASSQDDAAWNDRLRDRQRNYVTPRIIVPFVDRLILLGVLPKPKGYKVWWPDITSQSDQEKADVAMKLTAAMQQYMTGGVEDLMGAMDYLTRVLRFTPEEAASVLRNVGFSTSSGESTPRGKKPSSQPLSRINRQTPMTEVTRQATQISLGR